MRLIRPMVGILAKNHYFHLIKRRVVEGVEDLQIEYGWNTDGDEDGALFFGDASEVPADQWNFVDRIRVTLTFNSVESLSGASDDDNLGRRDFTTTIALKNQIRD